MTDRELERYKERVREAYTDKTSEEYKKIRAEIWCRKMVNSILCYGGFGWTAEKVFDVETKSYHNYLKEYTDILGKNRVIEIIQEQMDSIYDVRRGVYEDGEGCVYNAIIWKDGIAEARK